MLFFVGIYFPPVERYLLSLVNSFLTLPFFLSFSLSPYITWEVPHQSCPSLPCFLLLTLRSIWYDYCYSDCHSLDISLSLIYPDHSFFFYLLSLSFLLLETTRYMKPILHSQSSRTTSYRLWCMFFFSIKVFPIHKASLFKYISRLLGAIDILSTFLLFLDSSNGFLVC